MRSQLLRQRVAPARALVGVNVLAIRDNAAGMCRRNSDNAITLRLRATCVPRPREMAAARYGDYPPELTELQARLFILPY